MDIGNINVETYLFCRAVRRCQRACGDEVRILLICVDVPPIKIAEQIAAVGDLPVLDAEQLIRDFTDIGDLHRDDSVLSQRQDQLRIIDQY